MSKNIFTKLLICTIFIVIISNLFYVSSSYALGDIFADGKAFLETPGSKDISETINTTELEKTSDYIYNTLLAIGIMVAIVVAMVLGIQFMVASADEKAKVKEALMPFVVGCIVVFGAFTIWKVAVNIGNDAEDTIRIPITGETVITPGVSGYKCNYCGENIGDIPAGVMAGGRDYECPKCYKQIVKAGSITGATK